MPVVIGNDYIFITNNGVDFRPIFRSTNLHPGLIVILPSVPRQQQVKLFLIVLARLRLEPDTVNKLIEIDIRGVVTIRDYPEPTAIP